MNGETHQIGGLLVKSKLRLPTALLYLAVKPEPLISVLGVYLMYEFVAEYPSSLGSLLPDYDQSTYENSPSKLKEPLGEGYHNFLKRRGAKHRDTHTHNLDLWLIGVGTPTYLCLGMFINTQLDAWFLFFVFGNSLLFGVLSHQFLDTLTVKGTRQSHLLRKGKRDGLPIQVTPHARTMWAVENIRYKRHSTPFFRLVKTRFSDEDWGKTGGGWEDEIRYKMIAHIVNRNTFRWRILELILVILLRRVVI